MIDREIIKTDKNPNKIDYKIELESIIEIKNRKISVSILYIPHDFILIVKDFEKYLEQFSDSGALKIEEIAGQILDDLNNELIPRKIELTLEEKLGKSCHKVMMEDTQPGWKDTSKTLTEAA